QGLTQRHLSPPNAPYKRTHDAARPSPIVGRRRGRVRRWGYIGWDRVRGEDRVRCGSARKAKKLSGRSPFVRKNAVLHAKANSASRLARPCLRPVFWPIGQNSNVLVSLLRIYKAPLAILLAIALSGCTAPAPESTGTAAGTTSSGVARGGELLVSVRSEPPSFNRHASRESTTYLVTLLTQARLIRVN